ncbi:MAG: serine--tRNA ligase [Nisaea sp.]|nr:serine--tRNA ligase [Nisaea sp.]OUX95358.1 MAG: serine--tRNA ligase [Candidatus Endolissoclinum sp. TMED26]|tara:strand:+ start:2890 stop:4185 length:1296 start_codon:yes stop_codon:yes gene_type:complete
MHDIKFIRDNAAAFDAGLARRDLSPMAADILSMDSAWRALTTEKQTLQQRRNQASKEIGQRKSKGEPADELINEVADIKTKMLQLDDAERQAGEDLEKLLASLPNLPFDDVPLGADESENVEIRRQGERKAFNFRPLDHVDLGEKLGQMDFEAAAKLAGARFVLLRGDLARLERAIANFMIDLHTQEFGYTEVSPPVMVRDAALYGTGQLPKFSEDLFRTEDGFWMIPTAEVPLTNLVSNAILDVAELPVRVTAHTPCFRSEAGSAGRDTRGMIRVHQFAKVELVSVTHPAESDAELERMTACAEEVLKRLGLHYRVVVLCTGDMGFGARRTYDIEVWLPGQNDGAGAFREISSCSTCGDFQARRMKARFRPEGSKATEFVHTLNGSGLAVGRCLIAVLENHQEADGSISIPDVLRPYMGGQERIHAKQAS